MNTYNHTHTPTNSGKLIKARVHQPCTQDSCPIVIVSSEWWSIGEVVNHISDNRCHRHFFLFARQWRDLHLELVMLQYISSPRFWKTRSIVQGRKGQTSKIDIVEALKASRSSRHMPSVLSHHNPVDQGSHRKCTVCLRTESSNAEMPLLKPGRSGT